MSVPVQSSSLLLLVALLLFLRLHQNLCDHHHYHHHSCYVFNAYFVPGPALISSDALSQVILSKFL